MLVRHPPNVKDLADQPNCPLSSCHADSFLTFGHQRRGCSHARSVPFLSELANRNNSYRSEISYFEDEPWGTCLLLKT